MIIQVHASHINSATLSIRNCMIAKAMNESRPLPEGISYVVAPHEESGLLFIAEESEGKISKVMCADPSVSQKVIDWDNGQKVEPFSFTLSPFPIKRE